MDRVQMTERVVERIAGVLGVPSAELDEGTDLVAEYAVDSLDVMEIGTRLERLFAVRFTIEDLVGARRVGDVVDVLMRLAAVPT